MCIHKLQSERESNKSEKNIYTYHGNEKVQVWCVRRWGGVGYMFLYATYNMCVRVT